jgi:hypothetical protein
MMTRWAQAARAAGVAFDAGAAFTMNGTATSSARLGFACLNDHELRRRRAGSRGCGTRAVKPPVNVRERDANRGVDRKRPALNNG